MEGEIRLFSSGVNSGSAEKSICRRWLWLALKWAIQSNWDKSPMGRVDRDIMAIIFFLDRL